MTYTIQPFGERALLITLPSHMRPATIGRALTTSLGVATRVGLDTVVIFGNPLPSQHDITTVLDRAHAVDIADTTNIITIPVTYTGEDLNLVADTLGMNVADVISAHQNTTWQVALVGFAPGFPYLVPVDDVPPFARVPRLSTPRTHVPAGSVAVAAGMSAVYPTEMPGGWMLLGHTDLTLFNPDADHPSLLTAGDFVRFVEVTA